MIQLHLLVSWLDALFSFRSFVYWGAFVIWVGLVLFMVLRFTNSWKTLVFVLVLGASIPLALFLVNNNYWGYGYLREEQIPYFGLSEKYVGIDELYTTYSKGGAPYDHHRLYLLNAQTGELLLKKPLPGQAGVQALRWVDQRLLVVSGKESEYFSLQGGSQRAISKQQLQQRPELKSGIANYGYDVQSHQVWVVNKKGEWFYYNSTTLMPEAKQTNAFIPRTLRRIEPTSQIHFQTSQQKAHYCPISLQAQQQIKLEDGRLLDKLFIKAKVILYLPVVEVALVQSFVSTYHKKLLLTAVDRQGTVLWEYTQGQLAVTDFFSNATPKISYIVPTFLGNELIVLMGGYLLRMDPKTGKIQWKTRL